MSETRIYVACLASYNNGVLHGEWIDCEGKDADDLQEEVSVILRASRFPNVDVACPECDGFKYITEVTKSISIEESMTQRPCETCKGTGKVPSAEEFAIHDHEGFGSLIEEYTSLARVAELAALIEEHGEAFIAYAEHVGEDYADADGFQEAYQGQWRDEQEFAADLLDDIGELKDDSLASRYFDYEKFTRDLFMTDYYMAEGGHVFRNL